MNTNVKQTYTVPSKIDWTTQAHSSTGVSGLVERAVVQTQKSHEACALAAIGLAIHIHLYGDNSELVRLFNGLPASSDKAALGNYFVDRACVLSGVDVDKLTDKAATFGADDFPVLSADQRHQDLLTSDEDAIKALVLSITSFDLSEADKPKTINAPMWKVIMRKELEKQIKTAYTRSDSEEAQPMCIQDLRKHMDHCIDMGVITLNECQDYVNKTQSRASNKGKLIAHDANVFELTTTAGVHFTGGGVSKIEEADGKQAVA